ncbi:unnamed protein product [Spirodela intermedia]|uniref:Uncharacterized protein n=1 Tax=Spirodela intermedia TaxID=51605 RepID=A0A7I8JYB7_SPIIN|nr:unnamed protein product [Spirodela intermedia]
MGRAPCCEKEGLKKGRWTSEEDELLVNYIKAHGEGSWRSLPKNAGLLRCGKSCRLRWINYLRSDLKRGNISPEEEEAIIKLHTSLGNRWSLIAAQLPGRTDNEIKNYWNSHLSRRIHRLRRRDGDEGPAVIVDLGKIVGIPLRQWAGRTGRSAMKKENPVGTVDESRGQGGADGESEKTTQPPCGRPVESYSKKINPEALPESELLETGRALSTEFWEAASELLSPSWERGDGGWSAASSFIEQRECGPSMSSCTTSEERKDGPMPAVGQQPYGQAEECNSTATTGGEWLDVELEAIATKLWDEAGEAWPWRWEDASVAEHLSQQPPTDCYEYEQGALERWLL